MDLNYMVAHAKSAPPTHRLNAAKEALQQCLLGALVQQDLLTDVAFIGGTALRILYQLPRYSEDMDFIWLGSPVAPDLMPRWSAAIRRYLTKIGVVPHLSLSPITPVDARVQKRGVTLHVLAAAPALVPFARNGLQISFEIDLDPPAHVNREARTLVVANSQVTIPSLDLPSLLAGKLHILLTRRDREKGRDWYDYLWYRRNNVLPNVAQLRSAIDQTAEGPPAEFWMSHLRARMKTVNWENIRHDVRPFLQNSDEASQLSESNLSNLTPFLEFAPIATALRREQSDHPFASLPQTDPVIVDLLQAAAEGVEDAIETRSALESISDSRPDASRPT